MSKAEENISEEIARWCKLDTAGSWARPARQDRTGGAKALYSIMASTTSGRAKELVKQGLSDSAFGRIRERFGTGAGVAKLADVFQFPMTVWRTSG